MPVITPAFVWRVFRMNLRTIAMKSSALFSEYWRRRVWKKKVIHYDPYTALGVYNTHCCSWTLQGDYFRYSVYQCSCIIIHIIDKCLAKNSSGTGNTRCWSLQWKQCNIEAGFHNDPVKRICRYKNIVVLWFPLYRVLYFTPTVPTNPHRQGFNR